MESGPLCQGQTYSRLAVCGRAQAIQAGSDHPNRVVSPFSGLSGVMNQVAPTTYRPVCNEIQQQITLVCVISSRLPDLGSGCTQSALGGSESTCLPTSGGRSKGQPMQENYSDCFRVAQHALLLGPGGYVSLNPVVPAQSADSSL